MTDSPVSLAFFDSAQGIHGTARQGMTLLFSDGSATAIAEAPDLNEEGDGYRARASDRLDLSFSPLSEDVALAGASTRVCRVEGTVDGTRLECLGTATATERAPAWAELDAVRTVSALFDAEHAVLAVAQRPRGAPGHGHELVSAALLSGGELSTVEVARLSTVYDGEGRQRSASLELWIPAEDFPRRASGEAIAGTTLELPGLQVNAAVFQWRMEGREGAGAYDVTFRAERATAA